tara:strand:+ start:619 stop:1035 length:417 start_codon:yes stop_codon:yes gene_type:complete
MALQTITKEILTRTDGSALLDLPYDMSWIAGYDKEWALEDIAVKTYGQSIMARPGEFIGEEGYIDTEALGQSCIVDVLKNNSTIYSTKPQFTNGQSALSSGTISTTTFISGDKITFKVTQTGSTTVGRGVRFTLKCRV